MIDYLYIILYMLAGAGMAVGAYFIGWTIVDFRKKEKREFYEIQKNAEELEKILYDPEEDFTILKDCTK